MFRERRLPRQYSPLNRCPWAEKPLHAGPNLGKSKETIYMFLFFKSPNLCTIPSLVFSNIYLYIFFCMHSYTFFLLNIYIQEMRSIFILCVYYQDYSYRGSLNKIACETYVEFQAISSMRDRELP